jgi:hypothetical protein
MIKRRIFQKYSFKCQRIFTVDGDIEAKNVNTIERIEIL